MTSRKKKNSGFQPSRLFWFLLATITVIVSIWAFLFSYTIQKYSVLFSFGSVRVLVFSPKYLSPNEDDEIRFAFENPTANSIDVTFRLDNNSGMPGFLGLLDNNVIYSGDVESQQQINRQMKVFFYTGIFQEPSHHVSRLILWGRVDDSPPETKKLEIYLAPIPWARSLSNRLGVVLLGLGGFLWREAWDQVKKVDKKKP